MNSQHHPLLIAAALLIALVASVTGAAVAQDAAPMAERHRAFLEDGPGFLMQEDEIGEFLGLDEAGRDSFVEGFLVDPIPETLDNELVQGIERRQRLAQETFLTPKDVRYRLLFLAGEPQLRQEIDCGQTFRPLEIWSFGDAQLSGQRALEAQRQVAAEYQSETKAKLTSTRPFKGWDKGPKLILYRPNPSTPYRLWEPYETKAVLYAEDMQYILQQVDELLGRIRAKKERFDRRTCVETKDVDLATGVEGLYGFQKGRPSREAILSFMEPPADLAAWAREAAGTRVEEREAELKVESFQTYFPEKQGQRILTRMMLTLPPDAGFEPAENGDVKLVVDGVLETGETVFEDFRARYTAQELADGQSVVIAIDRALRPGTPFVARFRLRDTVGGGIVYASGSFVVPDEPDPKPEGEEEEKDLVILGADLAEQAARNSAFDSLILAPPVDGEVVIGVWRAEALVTGRRIVKVDFLVDGKKQLTRKRPPFSVDVRLANYPTEQVVTAEGYDENDELVAKDEVIVNQPRGAFRVRIVEPRRGVNATGTIQTRAEVVVPEDRRIDRVEFRVNDQLVTTLEKPPWIASVELPTGGDVTYVSAVAFLDDNQRAEDVRFVNAPKYLDEINVKLIELYTTVTDRSGRLARDLKQEDFTVLEDKRPQQITKFELVENLPLTVSITIDTSGSMASTLSQAQAAGRAFLERVMKNQDRCFVVGFAAKPLLLMPPTDDVVACTAGLEGLQAVGWTALHDAIVTSLYFMRELRGQRALVLLSDGDDTASSLDFDEALEYARKSGVTIFTIGIDSELNSGGLGAGIRRKLGKLALETGGRSFYVENIAELNSVYDEIEAELRSRYLIAYSPDRPPGDGAYREIDIKVKGRGLKARSLRGYYP